MNTVHLHSVGSAEWGCTVFMAKFGVCSSTHHVSLSPVATSPCCGSPLRFSTPYLLTPEYPPANLFDIVYAGAVLHHFSTPAVKDGLTTVWNIYYPTGVMNSRHSDFDAIADAVAAARRYGKGRYPNTGA